MEDEFEGGFGSLDSMLQWAIMPFSYNPKTVWKAWDVPLHPGAARYYKERGYTK